MDLCLSCGMCCDGTLFSSVEIAPDENFRLPVVSDGDRRKVIQPCPALHEGRCQVYADRPRSCREFRCAPLEKVESGAMSEAEATAMLGRAKALAARVKSRLGDEGPLWRTVESVIGSESWRRRHGDLLLDIALLRELLRKIKS